MLGSDLETFVGFLRESGVNTVTQSSNAFSKKNEVMRIETFEKLEDNLEAPLMAFFRHIGLPHLYWEHLVPVMREGNTVAVAAVKDRVWPPWGVGAQTIHALALACPVADDGAGISNVFVLEEDVGNIGLVAAVYKEMVGTLIRRGVKELSYIVLDGSVFASRVLGGTAFKQTEELVLTHGNKYNVFSADPQAHLKAMGLDSVALPDLMDGNLDDNAFSKVAQWIGATSVGSTPFWTGRASTPEVIPNTAGLHRLSRPGGTSIRRFADEAKSAKSTGS